MVGPILDPGVSPAPGGSLYGLLARKGEAAPAATVAPVQPERLPATAGRTAEVRRPGTDSPLAFLIARRPGAAAPAVDTNTRREVDASVCRQRDIELAAAPRRSLTVRLRQDDFLRLRALTEVRGTTYQSLIEAGILGVLSADRSASAEAPAVATLPARVAPAAAASAKRRSLGR